MDEKESMILGPAGLYKLVAHAVKPWRTPNGDVFVDLWMDDIRHTVPVKSEASICWRRGVPPASSPVPRPLRR
jgi:hypothetical protein